MGIAIAHSLGVASIDIWPQAIPSTAGVTIPQDTDEDDGHPRPRRASAPLVADDRYVIGAPIGRGGMGEVVSAHDVQIGREIAIKRLLSTEPSPAALARFLREARIQGRLEHPAIPPVHELAYDDDGRPYFVMRKLEGVTLADTLRDPHSPFSRQRLLRAFIDVCNAIDLAHSRGVVHRDLKPANVLLGERGEVFVLDWGIARELDSPDAFAGITLGTPGYMAPEQIRSERNLDERVDVYALGCLLFEVLTRRALHPRGEEGLRAALEGVFPDGVDLPPELDELCRRATAVKREQRVQTVRELGDTVQRFLDGDRDLVRRSELAHQHLASARAAFFEVRDEHARRSIVMREAGQALALDPTLPGAAELIGRIMIEPPVTPPLAVLQEIAELDAGGSRMLERLTRLSACFYVALVPVFLLFGIHDVPYLTAYGGLSLSMLVVSIAGLRDAGFVRHGLYLVLMISMFGLLARMFTPVLVAPGIAAVSLAAMAFNPVTQRRGVTIIVTVATLVSIFAVWLAEVVGLLSPTMRSFDGRILLMSPVDGIAGLPAFPVLAVLIAALISIAAGFGYIAMRQVRAARERLVLQAWHLRQLV